MHKLALVAVLSCAGCVVPSGSNRGEEPHQESQSKKERTTAILAAASADKAAGRENGVTASDTVAYWLGLKAALHPIPIDPDPAARKIVNLLTLGVDPELVREGQLVGEKMRAAAAAINSISTFEILFHFPRTRLVEAAALSRAAIEQCQVVERMRPDLTARYGVEFPPLDVPTPRIE